MPNASRDFQAEILNDIRAKTLEVALYTTDPTVADTGTEVTGGSYARTVVTFAAPAVSGGADGTEMANSATVSFPQASADWSSGSAVTHWSVRENGGNMIAFGSLDVSRVVRTGDVFEIPAGDLVIKVED